MSLPRRETRQSLDLFGVEVWRVVLFSFAVIHISACSPVYRETESYTYTTYTPTSTSPSCDNIGGRSCKKADIADCEARALSGDVSAMVKVGDIYSQDALLTPAVLFPVCREHYDPKKAITWWKKAREHGSTEALYRLYRSYEFGELVPKNTRISDSFLEEAVKKGADWAIQADIGRKVRIGDKTAINDLIKQAVAGNCHAQSDLVHFYIFGTTGVEDKTTYDVRQNLTKAYFWSLVTRTNRRDEKQYDISGYKLKCGTGSFLDREEMEQIPHALVVRAEDEAAHWSIGKPEPDLRSPTARKEPEPKVVTAPTPTTPEKKQVPDKIILPNVGELDLFVDENARDSRWKWLPATLPRQNNTKSEAWSPAELFRHAEKYVWTVIAARTISQLKSGVNLSQGSAVAVTEDTLLTNCHVIAGNGIIVVKQKNKFDVAKVISGDSTRDKCVLEVANQVLIPSSGIRSYSTLETGEPVFTVGSPSGLENTLSPGLISGLRILQGQRLIQTNAPISPGSSGGGLFDSYGNLIGITTFMIKDTQGVNFAVAVEEYAE